MVILKSRNSVEKWLFLEFVVIFEKVDFEDVIKNTIIFMVFSLLLSDLPKDHSPSLLLTITMSPALTVVSIDWKTNFDLWEFYQTLLMELESTLMSHTFELKWLIGRNRTSHKLFQYSLFLRKELEFLILETINRMWR